MTQPRAYYNEHDPEKAEVLRHLMAKGWIAPGDVDQRDIRDVTPDQLSGYAQCHFFAGIGLWSVAARRAGIPDDFPLWSGSCPCQPFSGAGAGEGIADHRHLWPFWYWLVSQRRPYAVVGEQVASADGLAWFDLVSADMEGSDYAGGAIDLCSAGFGSPNIRQRLYMCWLGHGGSAGLEGFAGHGDHGDEPGWQRADPDGPIAPAGDAGGVANARREPVQQRELAGNHTDPARQDEIQARQLKRSRASDRNSSADSTTRRPDKPLRDPVRGLTNGFWTDVDWLLCRDPDGPRLRPVEPGTFCLAARYPGRNGALRGYGDAINLEVATGFLKACWPEMRAGYHPTMPLPDTMAAQ